MKKFLNQKEEVIQFINGVSDHPVLSIIVGTYNHEKYIEKCISCILNQKTNFDFEILIGEDASSDDTRIICKELAERHPEKIRLFLHSRENVIIANGKVTGRFNFLYGLSQAKGKYIALCDGDDYWTDPLKLQKQVDFLEANSTYAGSSHWVDIINQKGKTTNTSRFRFEGDINLLEMLKNRWTLIQTGSFMFRKETVTDSFIKNFLSYNLGSGDSYLFAIISTQGPVNVIPKVMSVYRKHDGGYTSRSNIKSKEEQKKFNIKALNDISKYLDFLNEVHNYKFESVIRRYQLGLKIDMLELKLNLPFGKKIASILKRVLNI